MTPAMPCATPRSTPPGQYHSRRGPRHDGGVHQETPSRSWGRAAGADAEAVVGGGGPAFAAPAAAGRVSAEEEADGPDPFGRASDRGPDAVDARSPARPLPGRPPTSLAGPSAAQVLVEVEVEIEVLNRPHLAALQHEDFAAEVAAHEPGVAVLTEILQGWMWACVEDVLWSFRHGDDFVSTTAHRDHDIFVRSW